MSDNGKNGSELGRIGQRRYGGVIYEEFLPELRGKRGIAVYNEMSENDDIVGAILFAIEMLLRQCDWNVEPGGDSAGNNRNKKENNRKRFQPHERYAENMD